MLDMFLTMSRNQAEACWVLLNNTLKTVVSSLFAFLT